MTSLEVQTLLSAFDAAAETPEFEFTPPDLEWLRGARDEEVDALLAGLVQQQLPWNQGCETLLAAVFHQLCIRMRRIGRSPIPPSTLAMVAAFYGELGRENRARSFLLQLLATSGQPAELAQFAELVVADPPMDREAVGLAFGPLFQEGDYPIDALFPGLLSALSHPSVSATIMDLCNYATRESLVPVHPASDRKDHLVTLLGSVVQRLALLEEKEEVGDDALEEVAQTVDESVALSVSLCDALALIGETSAVGKLYQAMELRHRRLRTEAAAALARMGEDAGRETLVELASEPVCRLRVLAYAEELDLADEIDDEYQTPAAQGESELALWLAQPTQFGIPPTQIELIETRTLYWPGYEHPVDCFLFRFEYCFADAEYCNLGIAGPLAHAFPADLTGLSRDDAFAVFAGWHVQHEEIYEINVNEMVEAQRVEVSRLERRLHDAGYASLRPLRLGYFLGDRWLAAKAVWQEEVGTAIADQQDVEWFADTGYPRPLGPREAICIYKGRKLLETFNP